MSWSLLLAGPSLSKLLVVYCSMSGHTFWERLNCRMSKGTTQYQGSAFKNVNERTPLSSCKLAPHQFVWTVKKKKMAQRIGLQLFVSRLSSYTTNHELKRLFSPFGAVSEGKRRFHLLSITFHSLSVLFLNKYFLIYVVCVARLVVESKTLRPKGFGFVTFESEADAHKALKAMNGRVFSYFLICFFLNVFLMATKLSCRKFSLFLVFVNSVILHGFLAQTL